MIQKGFRANIKKFLTCIYKSFNKDNWISSSSWLCSLMFQHLKISFSNEETHKWKTHPSSYEQGLDLHEEEEDV